jgi:ATP-dependent DNA helicase DinG
VIVPEMLVKLKQGFGRLIRTERDSGCVAILDSRVNRNGHYRERVIEALPSCPITSDIEDISEFMVTRKSIDYFDPDFTI